MISKSWYISVKKNLPYFKKSFWKKVLKYYSDQTEFWFYIYWYRYRFINMYHEEKENLKHFIKKILNQVISTSLNNPILLFETKIGKKKSKKKN